MGGNRLIVQDNLGTGGNSDVMEWGCQKDSLAGADEQRPWRGNFCFHMLKLRKISC